MGAAIAASTLYEEGLTDLGYFNILTPVNGSKFDLSGLKIVATGTGIEISGFTYIPEPSTAILARPGLMGVCFRRRRRA